MNGMRKKLAVGAAAGLLAVVMAMPAYGAKRTAITSITLTIKADIEPNTDFGSENIEIETNSSRFSVDGYEVMNTGFEWTSDTVPEIRITLTAEDDYYFKALPKDKIKLKGGAEFVKGTRPGFQLHPSHGCEAALSSEYPAGSGDRPAVRGWRCHLDDPGQCGGI